MYISLMRGSITVVAALTAVAVLPTALSAQPRTAAPDRPKLVVFLTVDQMRSDYVDRWSSQLTGGLARLGKHGAFFANAFHDHANTETAPGHSVTRGCRAQAGRTSRPGRPRVS